MTMAVCIACGARKFGAFVPCPECRYAPQGAEEHAKALILSDHFLDATSLGGVASTLRAGDAVIYPEDALRGLAASIRGEDEKQALFDQWAQQSERPDRRLQWFILIVCLALGTVVWRFAA